MRGRARQPSINTRGKSDLMHAGRFTCWGSYRCRALLVNNMFTPHTPFPAYGICSRSRTAVFSYKNYQKEHRFRAELHSRSVDKTFWTTEYEEIIEKSGDEAA